MKGQNPHKTRIASCHSVVNEQATYPLGIYELLACTPCTVSGNVKKDTRLEVLRELQPDNLIALTEKAFSFRS